MSWVFNHQEIGGEFDWLAIDIDQFIAVLSTAGFGPIAKPADMEREYLYDLFCHVEDLPILGSCRKVGDPGGCIDWFEYAKRGLYAYDWDQKSNCYVMIAYPEFALNLINLKDSRMAEVARQIQIDKLFSDAVNIAPDTISIIDRKKL